jgi:hypothetical protein
MTETDTHPFIGLRDGKFVVHEETANLLSKIEGPIVPICVAGNYRTGKVSNTNESLNHENTVCSIFFCWFFWGGLQSFLLNCLSGAELDSPASSHSKRKRHGFTVGETTNACTRGSNAFPDLVNFFSIHRCTLARRYLGEHNARQQRQWQEGRCHCLS